MLFNSSRPPSQYALCKVWLIPRCHSNITTRLFTSQGFQGLGLAKKLFWDQLAANQLTGQLAANQLTGQLADNQLTGQLAANQLTGQLAANQITDQLADNQFTGQLA